METLVKYKEGKLIHYDLKYSGLMKEQWQTSCRAKDMEPIVHDPRGAK